MIVTTQMRDIAAQYQTPQRGDTFAAFASTGAILADFLDDIDAEYKASGDRNLMMLRGYVDAQNVTVWSVGHNMPGYLPDTPAANFATVEWQAACDMLRDDIGQSACGCECTHDDPVRYGRTIVTGEDGMLYCDCHACRDQREITAILADPALPRGTEPRERRGEFTVAREYGCRPAEVYWLRQVSGKAGDLFGV